VAIRALKPSDMQLQGDRAIQDGCDRAIPESLPNWHRWVS
jgi:hypothetical protein